MGVCVCEHVAFPPFLIMATPVWNTMIDHHKELKLSSRLKNHESTILADIQSISISISSCFHIIVIQNFYHFPYMSNLFGRFPHVFSWCPSNHHRLAPAPAPWSCTRPCMRNWERWPRLRRAWRCWKLGSKNLWSLYPLVNKHSWHSYWKWPFIVYI